MDEQNENAETTNESVENQAAENQTEKAAASETEEKTEQKEEAKEITPEEKIEQLEKENADLKDQLLRRAADFDNYRKRMIKEKQDAFDYGNANLLGDLLESLDNFDRTIEAAKDAKDAASVADGIKMISKSLVSMLEQKYGLTSYGKAGDLFDPEIHEAIGRVENEKAKKETLKEVYLKGYKLKDRTIRLAKVMVEVPKA